MQQNFLAQLCEFLTSSQSSMLPSTKYTGVYQLHQQSWVHDRVSLNTNMNHLRFTSFARSVYIHSVIKRQPNICLMNMFKLVKICNLNGQNLPVHLILCFTYTWHLCVGFSFSLIEGISPEKCTQCFACHQVGHSFCDDLPHQPHLLEIVLGVLETSKPNSFQDQIPLHYQEKLYIPAG